MWKCNPLPGKASRFWWGKNKQTTHSPPHSVFRKVYLSNLVSLFLQPILLAAYFYTNVLRLLKKKKINRLSCNFLFSKTNNKVRNYLKVILYPTKNTPRKKKLEKRICSTHSSMPKKDARIYLLLALFSVLFFNEDHPLLFILQPTTFFIYQKVFCYYKLFSLLSFKPPCKCYTF